MSDGSDKVDFRKTLPNLYNPYAEDLRAFEAGDKSAVKWTMMIRQPDWISVTMYETAVAGAAKENPDLRCDALRLKRLAEGLCVQCLHVGSYDDEAPKLHQLHHELMPDGIAFNGHHHEIYLSDPRKVSADGPRTILRQSVRSIGREPLVRAAAP